MAHGCHDGQHDRLLIQRPARRRTAHPAAAAQAGVPGDRLGPRWRAAGKQPQDLLRHAGGELDVLGGPALPVPFPAADPGILVGQALLLRLLQRLLLDQQALPLVPLAGPAPPHHHRRQPAGLLRPAGQRGIPGRQEHQVVHVGAGQAQRAGAVHDQQVTGALALRALPVPHRLDDHKVRRRVLRPGDLLSLAFGRVGRHPAGPPGGLLGRRPVGQEAKLVAVPGRGGVGGLGALQAARGCPLAQVAEQERQPRVVHRQEVLQVAHAAAPPVIDVPVLQPAKAEADIDRRDGPLPGQRLLGSRHDPGFQAPLAHVVSVTVPARRRAGVGRRGEHGGIAAAGTRRRRASRATAGTHGGGRPAGQPGGQVTTMTWTPTAS
jgi:hypothetical protein